MRKPILLLLLIFVFAASSYGQGLLSKRTPVDIESKIMCRLHLGYIKTAQSLFGISVIILTKKINDYETI